MINAIRAAVRHPVYTLLVALLTIVSAGLLWITYLLSCVLRDFYAGIKSRYEGTLKELGIGGLYLVFYYILFGWVFDQLLKRIRQH